MAANVALTLASGNGLRGANVSLDLTIASTGGAAPTSIQWTFSNTADVTLISVTLGAAGISASKSLTQSGSLCIVAGFNVNVIPDGVLATAVFQIAASPSVNPIPIDLTGVVASDASANPIPTTETFAAVTFNVSVSVFDSVTVTEARTLTEVLKRLVSDASSGIDVVTMKIGSLPLSVSDSSAVTESITRQVVTKISVNDNATITEAVTINEVVTWTFSVFDASTVAEDVSVSTITGGPAFLTTSDAASVSESITIAESAILLSVFDASTVAEFVSVPLTAVISVSDSATVIESTAQFSISIISTFNSVAVTESFSLSLGGYRPSVSDSVTVTESFSSQTASVDFLSVLDLSFVTEDVALSVSTGRLVFDSSAVSESFDSFLSLYNLSVSDSVSVTESTSVALTQTISVNDSSSVAESISLSFVSDVAFIAVSDSANVVESISIPAIRETVSLNDFSTASESISIAIVGGGGGGGSLSFLVFDDVGVTEFVNIVKRGAPLPPRCIVVPPPDYASPLLLFNEPVEQVGT